MCVCVCGCVVVPCGCQCQCSLASCCLWVAWVGACWSGPQGPHPPSFPQLCRSMQDAEYCTVCTAEQARQWPHAQCPQGPPAQERTQPAASSNQPPVTVAIGIGSNGTSGCRPGQGKARNQDDGVWGLGPLVLKRNRTYILLCTYDG